MSLRGVTASIIGLGLIAMACQVDGQTTIAPAVEPPAQPAPTAVPQPTKVPDRGQTSAQISDAGHQLDGREIYATVGCAACHGDDAQGTDIAPALTGHSVAQVKRQARAPIGIMPVFSPDIISNEELQRLAEYIAELGGGHAHVRSGVSGDELIMHHWMAIIALESGEAQEAAHHVDHILQGAEGQHLRMMEKSRALLSEGEVHEAAHIIEQMLAGLDEAEVDQSTMHLRLALSSLRGEDLPSTIHHVEHFMESAAGDHHESAEQILEDLTYGELHEADEKLVLLLGQDAASDQHDEATGLDDAHDADEAEGAHGEADAHEADAPDEAEIHGEADAHDEADETEADEHEADAHESEDEATKE